MAMTGRKVRGDTLISIVTFAAAQLPEPASNEQLRANATRLARPWNVPIVPVFPTSTTAPALLSIALINLSRTAKADEANGAGYTVALAFVTTQADAFIPDEILEAVDWTSLEKQFGAPLEAGQRPSGRHRQPVPTA